MSRSDILYWLQYKQTRIRIRSQTKDILKKDIIFFMPRCFEMQINAKSLQG
jgi:hypothetical protein